MKKLGNVSKTVIDLLNLSIAENTPIYVGETNIEHMKNTHPNEYSKYYSEIPNILAFPDYVAENTKDNSLEYVKEYQIDNEYVKVAVRVSKSGTLFVRSLYTLNRNRVNNFIAKGTLKPTT